MAERSSQFSPEELDRLEDALEGLEDLESLESFADAPVLKDRLEAYRDILALSREALPMEEVPQGILDGVIAQARDLPVPVRTPEPEARSRRGSVGRWLAPILGLAAGAAAVLFVIQFNKAQSEPEGPALAARSEQVFPDAEPAAEMEAVPERTGDGALSKDALALAEEEEPEKERDLLTPEGREGDYEFAADDLPTAGKRKSNQKPDAKNAPKAEPKKKAEAPGGLALGGQSPAQAVDLDKDEIYDLLGVADKKRRSGRCGVAESSYKQVLVSGPDLMAKARAEAGLGLCAEFRGDAKGASGYFKGANASFAGINGWIETERAKMPAATETKKSKNKAQHKADQPAPLEDSL